MSHVLEPGVPWANWARSERATPAFVARPRSVDEVRQVVLTAAQRGLTVKPVGSSHSFSPIAATTGIQIDFSGLRGVLGVEGNLVTMGAGTHLYELPELLAPHGLAMAVLGDIDRQTISGAISTGTHGTGIAFGGIPTQVRGMTLVTGNAEVITVSETENPELLDAVALGLGALGIIVEVTIECVPAFLLHAVERPEPIDDVLDSWLDRVARDDHVDTYWFPHTDLALTKTNTRLPLSAGRRPLGKVRHWFEDRLIANTLFTAALRFGHSVPDAVPALNRLASNLTGNREHTDIASEVFASTRSFRFTEMEYGLPLEHLPQAMREIRALIQDRGWKISFPIEFRASAPDDLMLSTATGQATGYIAVQRYYRDDPHEYYRAAETILRSYSGRPHWGKVHYRDRASLSPEYPRFDEFLAIRDRLDPERRFANPYLERVLGP